MTLYTPTGNVLVTSNLGIVGSGTPGTSVPDGATVDTYGAVTELISAASNVYGCDAFEVMVCNTLNPSALVGEMSVDILVGGATDDVLVSSLLVGGTFYGTQRSYWFPVGIPAGVRIAAQLSAGAAQTTEPRVMFTMYKFPLPPFRVGSRVTTYGTKTNNSRGVAVTPTASGGAASVTQITASTSADHFYLMPGFQVSTDSTISATTFINVGIGVGAATEERIGSWWFSKNASELQSGPWPYWGAWRHVPAASRLTILASNGGANDAAHDALIYAVS